MRESSRSEGCGLKRNPTHNMSKHSIMSRQPAAFLTIPELLAYNPADIHDSMVRTVGKLERRSVGEGLIWLVHCKAPYLELPIDSSLLQPFPYSQGMLYQFIGVIDGSEKRRSGVVVRALAFRCVAGLDMELYTRALAVRNGT